MIKFILIYFAALEMAFAGLPPTTSKGSGDASNITTFNYQFPNFTVTHTGTTAQFNVLGVAGGGTGDSSFTANQVLLGGTTTTGALAQVSGGTTGFVLTSNGTTSAPTWQANAAGWTQAGMLQNASLSASVATNALTINLIGENGSNPAANNAVVIGFRNATAATGTYSTISQQAALSIVVPSGATLGQVSAVNQYVWVYALNDGGTMDLCVSGVNVFFNTTLNASTQISAGATSGTTLYCASAHTGGKPTTLIGRELVNEATAGTWASGPTEIDINPLVVPTTTEVTNFPNTTIGTAAQCASNMLCVSTGTSIPAYGTVTLNVATYYREGQFLYIDWLFAKSAGGTTQAVNMLFNVPSASGCTIDTAQTGSSSSGFTTASPSVGTMTQASTNSGTTYHGTGGIYVYNSTQLWSLQNIAESANTATTQFFRADGWLFASGQSPTGAGFHAKVPCVGWSQYGP